MLSNPLALSFLEDHCISDPSPLVVTYLYLFPRLGIPEHGRGIIEVRRVECAVEGEIVFSVIWLYGRRAWISFKRRSAHGGTRSRSNSGDTRRFSEAMLHRDSPTISARRRLGADAIVANGSGTVPH